MHQRLLSALHRHDTLQSIIDENRLHFTPDRLEYFLGLMRAVHDDIRRERDVFYDRVID